MFIITTLFFEAVNHGLETYRARLEHEAVAVKLKSRGRTECHQVNIADFDSFADSLTEEQLQHIVDGIDAQDVAHAN